MLTRETIQPAPERPPAPVQRRLSVRSLGLSRFVPWVAPPWLVWRRVRERWLLLLATLAGLVTAVTLLAAIPLYAHAEAERLLQQDLGQRAHHGELAVGFIYTATEPGPQAPARHERMDALLRANARRWLGLSTLSIISSGESATQQLRVLRNGRFEDIYGPVTDGYLGYRHDLFKHIDLVDGRLPAAHPNASGEIEALIVSQAADQLPVKVGDHVLLYNELQIGPQKPPIKVRIVGVFRPRDPREQFWYGAPDAYQRRLGMFVSEDVFHRYVMTANQPFGSNLSWYFLFPQRSVTSATADTVIGGIEYTAEHIDQTYPQTMVDRTIYAAFERYDQVVQQLRLQLSIFAAPVIAIVLYYMSLVTRLLIESQRSEIAVLRSRGARGGQIVSLVTVDVIYIALPALALGLPLSILLTHLIGAAYGFLLFAEGLNVPVRFSSEAVTYGLIGIALALLSVIFAVAGASRQDVVARGRALSRDVGQPWWQRFFVDFLLLGIAIYGYSRLREAGGVTLTAPAQTSGPLAVDPLVLVLPVIFLAACGLLTARLLPAVAAVLSWLAAPLPYFPLPMALRQIARAPGHYTGLALLLVWTIGLGTFTAAAARTLDRRTVDATYYQVGTDVRFDEQGWLDADLGTFTYAPLDLAQKISGVLGATRVSTTQLRQQIVQPYGTVRVVGLDRVSFPAASWFRRDFASASLGELMNRLAANQSGVLVDRRFAEAAQLHTGNQLVLYSDPGNAPLSFVVVGILDYFPTLYATDGPYVVANRQYLQDWLGGLSQQLWFRVGPSMAASTLQAKLQDQGFFVLHATDARLLIRQQKLDPLRVGTFGILSVGFLAGILLTVLGFVMYTILAFRRRAAEFSVLRVLGLSRGQLSPILIVEHVLVVGAGAGTGGAAGILTSQLITPFLLAAETGPRAGLPPVLPVAPWDDVVKVWAVLAVVVLLTIPALVVSLTRRRLGESLRMGQVVE